MMSRKHFNNTSDLIDSIVTYVTVCAVCVWPVVVSGRSGETLQGTGGAVRGVRARGHFRLRGQQLLAQLSDCR